MIWARKHFAEWWRPAAALEQNSISGVSDPSALAAFAQFGTQNRTFVRPNHKSGLSIMVRSEWPELPFHGRRSRPAAPTLYDKSRRPNSLPRWSTMVLVCPERSSSTRPVNVQVSPGPPCDGETQLTEVRRWRRFFVNARRRLGGARWRASWRKRRARPPSSLPPQAGTRDARHALCKGIGQSGD